MRHVALVLIDLGILRERLEDAFKRELIVRSHGDEASEAGRGTAGVGAHDDEV